MCLNYTGDTTQTLTEILDIFIVLPKEFSLAQKNDQTTECFSKCDTGYLFFSHLYVHLSSLLYLPIEKHEEILKGKWLKDSYTKADPNENMTENS